MGVPDIETIYCSRCSLYNIGSDRCICEDCTNKIIDDWNYLGKEIINGKDTNKKVFRVGKKYIQDLKELFANVEDSEHKLNNGGKNGKEI